MSRSQLKPKSRENEIVVQEFENEVLVYDLKSNKAYCLNETSAAIWLKCNGNHSVSEITNELRVEIDSSIDEDFVYLALEQFKRDDLLEPQSEISSFFEGISRREIIRQVGLSSLVALPLVSSLVAPSATHAQSVACVGACQCPNATVNFCSPAAGGGTLDCNTLPNSPTGSCRCRLPFGAPASGTSPGQKVGNCG